MIARARMLGVLAILLGGAVGIVGSTQTWLEVTLRSGATEALSVPGASALPLLAPLSLAALAIIVWLVAHIWPWFAHSVWNATSLTECRQIIAQTWGEGASGACLAVIRERWQQFLFGFYPRDLYWRPAVAGRAMG